MTQIKIACISDTHTQHANLVIPECDILIHAGDFTYQGKKDESLDFIEWFSRVEGPKERVFIAGNHENGWDINKSWDKQLPSWFDNIFLNRNIHYLCNSSVELFGLNIFGSPITPDFFPEYWAFNRRRGEVIRKEWAKIPDDTNILVVHGPMKGVLDYVSPRIASSQYPSGHVGCLDLRDRVYQLSNLRLCVTGHIHDQTSIADISIGDRVLKYCNAAIVDNDYVVKHEPQIINLEI